MTEDLKYRISLEDIFSKGIANAENSAQSFERTVSSLQNKIVGLFGGFQAMNFAKSVVEVGGGFEAAEIGLTTLLKSADRAKDVFAQVKKDAAETPFDVKSLLLANRSLISAGVEAKQAREDVLNLANAVAATGGGNDELSRMVVNMQQIKNTGKATALDVKQFAYAGINIYAALAEATGKTTDQVKEMDVSYEMLTGALKRAHEEGGIYANGLENMSKTTNVMVSNLGDMWDSLKEDIFKQNKESIDGMILSITELIKWLKNNLDSIKNLAIAIGLAATAYALFISYQKIALWYTGLSTTAIIANTLVTEGWTAAQIALNMAMEANPIGLVIAGIAALSYAVFELIGYYNAAREAQDRLNEHEENLVADTEAKNLKKKYDELKQYKNEEMRLTQALFQEEMRLKTIIATAQENLNEKHAKGIFSGKEVETYANQVIQFNKMLQYIKNTPPSELFKRMMKGDPGPKGTDLGSGLNEPKASKIQNITINMGGVFANQKNTFANSVGEGVDDFMGKLSKALNAVVLDAAVIASE